MDYSLEPRKSTITKDDIPKWSILLPILWGLVGAWWAVLAVFNFIEGDYGYGIFYAAFTVLAVGLTVAWWNQPKWTAWNDKATLDLSEDIAASNYFMGTGDFDSALKVLKRTQNRPFPGLWEYFFRFDKSLYTK